MLDAKLIFDEDLDLGTPADCYSTNSVNVGAQEEALGEEEHIRLRISASEAFNDSNAANDSVWEFELVDCDTLGGTYEIIAQTRPLTAPEMPLGVIWDIGVPTKHRQFLKIHYEYTTGTGDLNAGKVNAHLYVR
jgi:hypothetical protein